MYNSVISFILLATKYMMRVKSYLVLFLERKNNLNGSLPAFAANGHVTGMPRRHKPDAESNIPIAVRGVSMKAVLLVLRLVI